MVRAKVTGLGLGSGWSMQVCAPRIGGLSDAQYEQTSLGLEVGLGLGLGVRNQD